MERGASFGSVVAKQKWTILLTVLATITVVAFGVNSSFVPRTVTARVVLHLLPYGANEDDRSQRLYTSSLTSTYIALSKSDLITDQVEQELRLTSLPEYELEPIAGSDLLQLTATAEDPELAREVANTMARMLVEQEHDAYVPSGVLAKNLFESEVVQLEAELESLDEQYWSLVSQVNASPEQIADLNRELEEKQRLYDAFVDQYGRARISEAMQKNMLEVIQPAYFPPTPALSATRPAVRIAVAAISGLIGGVALAVTLEQTDGRLFSSKRAEAIADLRVLGRIPRFDWNERDTLLNSQSQQLEAFRRLRARLVPSKQKQGTRTFLLTSPEPGAGKSTIIANLAQVFAESGRDVLVVDADMRRPAQHKLMNVSNRLGLSSILIGAATAREAIQATGIDHLHVVPSGPIPSNSTELLSRTEAVAKMLNSFQANYDVILFDTPPALAAADAAVLAPLVDRVLIVMMLSQTEEKAVAEVVRQFSLLDVELSGAIVNLADRDSSYHKRYSYKAY